jgi:NADP-dependent 3-hydroxy acid dehydrogenase YdfG
MYPVIIGLALARAFAKEDHALLLLARHMEPLPDLLQDRIAYAKADVADYGAVELAIRRAEDRFGKAECLVNNAGFAERAISKASIRQATPMKSTSI